MAGLQGYPMTGRDGMSDDERAKILAVIDPEFRRSYDGLIRWQQQGSITSAGKIDLKAYSLLAESQRALGEIVCTQPMVTNIDFETNEEIYCTVCQGMRDIASNAVKGGK